MTFTPSATSSFSAGAVFWGMVWATLGKLNELAHSVGFKKSNPRQTVLLASRFWGTAGDGRLAESNALRCRQAARCAILHA